MSSPEGSEDEIMEDAPTNGYIRSPTPEAPEELEPREEPASEAQGAPIQSEPQGVRTLPGSTDTAASFEILNEDHTLGNALRYIIMKNPVVEFCGYSIPHPSEAKMNIRIQTYDNASVFDVLEKGLNDLMDLCDVVLEEFTIARDEFGQTR